MHRVLIVGGEDVDKRLPLMEALRDEFELEAAGSDESLGVPFQEAGFPFHWFPLTRGPHPIADYRAYRCITRICRRRSPTLVHAFATKPTVWGRLAARKAEVPVIIGTLPGLGSLYSSHSAGTMLVRQFYETLQRRASSVSSMTVFQNPEDRRQLVEAGIVDSERTSVIPGSGVRTEVFDPDGIDPVQRQRVRREAGVGPDDVMVVMISRVIRSKGVLDFAAAADHLRTRPEVRLVLAGPDDRASRDRLNPEELARVSNALTWLGPREDVPAILAAADVFVLPSFYREGIPRVLLEAASMGLPLVATRIPGCEDVVQPGRNGILVDPHDVEALVGAVLRLADDVEFRERAGRTSRRLACDKFALPVIAKQTADLWRRAIARQTTPGVVCIDASG